MKKKIGSLLLCLVLVCSCFAGCGKEKDSKSAVQPSEMVSTKLQGYADKVTDLLKKETVAPAATGEFGSDIGISASIGAQIAAAYGLTGLESVGLNLSQDAKDGVAKFAAELALNGAGVLNADVYVDDVNVYVGLPKYSDKFFGESLKNLLGVSLEEYAQQMVSATEGMPTNAQLAEIWSKFAEDFIACFAYETSEEKVTVGYGDDTFTATKYINTCADPSALEKVIDDLMEKLAAYPALTVTEMQADFDFDSVQMIYYEDAEDQYAWEFAAEDAGKTIHTLFAVTEKGSYLYGYYDDEEPEVVFYQVKESDTKGKFVFVGDEEEYVINYDNYTKDSVELSGEYEGFEFTAKVETKEDSFYLDFTLNAMGIELTGKLESSSESALISVGLTAQGIEFGTVNVSFKTRSAEDFTAPTEFMDPDSWIMDESTDNAGIFEDMNAVLEQYPFLRAIIGGQSSQPSDSNSDYDDDYDYNDDYNDDYDYDYDDDDEEPFVMPEDYSDPFMGMTGYEVDEEGFVDFEPSEEEVLAIGAKSTAYDTRPVTQEQKQALIEIAENAFADPYYRADKYYAVYGYVTYDSVDSYYTEEYIAYDNDDFSNSVEVRFEAVSGELTYFAARNVDQQTAIDKFNEMLVAAGIDYTFTADMMGEYMMEENFTINSYTTSSSSSITFNVYED